MKTRFITSFLLCVPLFAQNLDNAAKLTAKLQVKNDALNAFRNGDQASGLAKLNGNVNKNARAPKEDIQVVAQLTEVTYWLANEKNSHASETALLTIAQVENSRTKFNKSEEAAALAANGELYERVVGDLAKAKSSYEDALKRDGAQPSALRGLARLRALQALADAKARENEALRMRAKNQIR